MSKPFAPAATPARWIRPRPIRVTHVDLDIAIELPAQRVAGVATHTCAIPAHVVDRVLELDQHGLTIHAVTVDGTETTFSRSGDRLAIMLPAGRPTCVVAVRFTTERPLKGLYFIVADPAQRRVAMAWTQGAMEDHAYWFPCFDDPNNLSTYRIAIRHDAGLTAIANGERTARTEHGDGTATTVHEQRQPHVLYLLNVAVGDVEPVADPTGTVPIVHWMPRGRTGEAAAMFRSTAFAIRWLGDAIGVPYPWTRYGHVVVHGFMWGGMENTTLTTITDRCLMDAGVQVAEEIDCDSLVVHELVHQWFGDLLTMKGWSDIWLNESFATWLEARGTAAWQATLGRDEDDELAHHLWQNRAAYLDEDSGRYRRALVTNRYADAYELFDRVAYEKGSLVLHMLHRLIGDAAMHAALTLYVRRHTHDLVETADWRQAVEDITGDPLDWFFDQWVHRAGHPVLKVRHRHDPVRGQVVVTIEQTQAATDAEAVFRLLTSIVIDGVRHAVLLDRASQTVVLPASTAPAVVCLDPDGDLLAEWDDGDDAAALIVRLTAAVGPAAKGRACQALGKLLATPAIIAALTARLIDAGEADLVREEAAAALGALDDAAARAALLAALPALTRPRLRRSVAAALAKPIRAGDAGAVARALVASADAEPSLLTAGELLAARGAIEFAGATPELRARLRRDSWNQRLRSACLRGLGASGEPAAADDILAILADDQQIEPVRVAACGAAARLGRMHLLLRDRVRRAIETVAASPTMHLRAAAAKALGTIGDPAGRAVLASRLEREPYGNVRRIIREAQEQLATAAAATEALATAGKRIDELDAARKKLELRLDALEKRLSER